MRALFSFCTPFVLVVPEKTAIPAFPTIWPVIPEKQYQLLIFAYLLLDYAKFFKR